MKICIDARSPGQAGILNYTSCLLKSLLKIGGKYKYTIITDSKHRNMGHSYEAFDEIVVPSSNPLFWIIWSNAILPRILEEREVDIYHSFKHVTAYRLKAKKILTFHGGPMLYRFPEFYKWYDLIYWKWSYSMAAKNYDRIITVSESEQKYFKDKLGLPENKFRITNLAADERFRVIEDKDKLRKVKEKFNLPDKFILFVGRIHPVKNLEGVIKGYFKAQCLLKEGYKLVIVGGRVNSFTRYFKKIQNLIAEFGITDDVLFLSYISDDLPCIYNLADLFLFPTNYESWSLVVNEAMACGVPVILSDIAEMHEVFGDAGILINPVDDDEIAKAIVQVLSSSQLRQSLIQRGLAKVKLFSWDRCARETLKIYEELGQE